MAAPRALRRSHQRHSANVTVGSCELEIHDFSIHRHMTFLVQWLAWVEYTLPTFSLISVTAVITEVRVDPTEHSMCSHSICSQSELLILRVEYTFVTGHSTGCTPGLGTCTLVTGQ